MAVLYEHWTTANFEEIIWVIIVKFQNVWKSSSLYNIQPNADFSETYSMIDYIYFLIFFI